jgi:hypothetical protein
VGWTSQFRETVLTADACLSELLDMPLDASGYRETQALGSKLREAGSDGVVYRSVRGPQGSARVFSTQIAPKKPIQGAPRLPPGRDVGRSLRVLSLIEKSRDFLASLRAEAWGGPAM